MAFIPASTKIYLVPFIWKEHQRWDRLGVQVSPAEAGKIAKIGIYLDTNGTPSRRLFQSSEISLASTGAKTETIDIMLKPGVHWLAFAGDSTTAGLVTRIVRAPLGRALIVGSDATYGSDTFSYTSGADLPQTVAIDTWYTDVEVAVLALRAA